MSLLRGKPGRDFFVEKFVIIDKNKEKIKEIRKMIICSFVFCSFKDSRKELIPCVNKFTLNI